MVKNKKFLEAKDRDRNFRCRENEGNFAKIGF